MNRNNSRRIIFSLIFIATLPPLPARAGSVDLPNSFTAGTPAVAAKVNANFNAVKTAVDDNDARIGDNHTRVEQLETQVATLEAELDARITQVEQLQDESATLAGVIQALQTQLGDLQDALDSLSAASGAQFVGDLQNVMLVETDAQGNPAVVFTGANVYINNGAGATDTVNGRGNLIVGYNEPRTSGLNICSIGEYDNLTACQNGGGLWQVSHKSGSHTVVIGRQHNYSRYGGLVVGYRNTVNGDNASISGGREHIASGLLSSISGGTSNTTSGDYSSVSGGAFNVASGIYSSIGGGTTNTANGNGSSISGGIDNRASGLWSSVSSGRGNIAGGNGSSISGGRNNITGSITFSGVGEYSSISGGNGRAASDTDDWVAGSLFEDN